MQSFVGNTLSVTNASTVYSAALSTVVPLLTVSPYFEALDVAKVRLVNPVATTPVVADVLLRPIVDAVATVASDAAAVPRVVVPAIEMPVGWVAAGAISWFLRIAE